MPFARLIAMCAAMLVGTIVVGHIPLAVSMSSYRVKVLSTFGSGLLVGAALSVIIPEGVEAVYSASSSSTHASQGHSHESEVQSQNVAMALLLGFVLMYLIDSFTCAHPESQSTYFQLPRSKNFKDDVPSETPTPPRLASEANLEHSPMQNIRRNEAPTTPTPLLARRPSHSSLSGSSPFGLTSTTIGLVTHSLADGISLGASIAVSASEGSQHSSLDLIVFVAIMVHKAPAAFGLCAVLLREGASRAHIRKALVFFAVAAPLGAVVTFLVLRLVGSSNNMDLPWWTGMALLFSGGTFLFVATHSMEEANESSHDDESSDEKLSRTNRVFVNLLGMFVPVLLQMTIGHSH